MLSFKYGIEVAQKGKTMKNPDETYEAARKMSYEQLLAAAGSPKVTARTYLYVDVDGDICWTEIDSDQTPNDEYVSLGNARRLRGVRG